MNYIYNDNKPCPRTHEPPLPAPFLLGEPESKNIGFIAPIEHCKCRDQQNHKYVI